MKTTNRAAAPGTDRSVDPIQLGISMPYRSDAQKQTTKAVQDPSPPRRHRRQTAPFGSPPPASKRIPANLYQTLHATSPTGRHRIRRTCAQQAALQPNEAVKRRLAF